MPIDRKLADKLPGRVLMYYQNEAERRLGVFDAPFVWHPMPPPEPGEYMVTRVIDDDGKEFRSTGMCYFDGQKWPRMGGYVRYVSWGRVPRPDRG